MEALPRKRLHWLDFARFFAILSISLNHALHRSYEINLGSQYAEYLTLGAGSVLFESVIAILSRIGVPLFLMISGALLLNKDFSSGGGSDVRRFYKHNLLPLFITTEIWLFLMFFIRSVGRVYGLLRNPGGILPLLRDLLLTMCFVNQETFGNMWYMPMIFCLYLLIPFLAILLKKFGGRYFLIPAALVALSSFLIPNINAFLALIGQSYQLHFEIDAEHLFSPYLLYLVTGYYISRGALRRLGGGWVLAGCFGSLAALCGYQYFAISRPLSYEIGYHSVGMLILSAFAFEAIRRFLDRDAAFVRYIAKISFGIYFVHIILMGGLAKGLDHFRITMAKPLRLIVLEAASMVGSVLIIWLLSKFKWGKKYLFLIKD